MKSLVHYVCKNYTKCNRRIFPGPQSFQEISWAHPQVRNSASIFVSIDHVIDNARVTQWDSCASDTLLE